MLSPHFTYRRGHSRTTYQRNTAVRLGPCACGGNGIYSKRYDKMLCAHCLNALIDAPPEPRMPSPDDDSDYQDYTERWQGDRAGAF